MGEKLRVPRGKRVDETVLTKLGGFAGIYRSPRLHRPRWPYCSRPWCPGNRAYNGRYYVKATEPLEEDEEISLYHVTELTKLMSSLWVLAASESLHGWPAKTIPLASTLMATRILGLEPYLGGNSSETGELRLESISGKVVVIGAGLGGLIAAEELRRAGVKTVIVDYSGGTSHIHYLLGDDEARQLLSKLGNEIVSARYIGRYDEGHAFLSSDALYVTKGPVVYAMGGEAPPPITVNNDLPGIVSASYGLELVGRLGYRPRRVVVLGYGYLAPRVADWFAERGIETRLVALKGSLPEKPERAELVEAERVEGFLGTERVEAVIVDGERFGADMVVSALGVYPDSLPVYAAGYKPVYLGTCYRFVPEIPEPSTSLDERGGLVAAGIAAGYEWPEAVKASARYAAALVARSMGKVSESDVEHYYQELRSAIDEQTRYCPRTIRPPVWLSGEITGLQLVDLDEDLALYHIYSAWSKGYKRMEMLKRVTGLGTGPDQGRFSATTAAIVLAAISGTDPGEIGVFRPRPPYFVPEAHLLAKAPTEW